MRSLLLLAALCAVLPAASAFYTAGKSNGKNTLVFTGKFCFGVAHNGSDPAGTVTATITTEQGNLVFAAFDDQPLSWPAVYGNSNCDCNCMLAAARATTPVPASGGTLGFKVFEEERPHFWYTALISCSTPVEASWKETFKQTDGSQVGSNNSGLFALYLVFLFLWGAGTAAQWWSSRELWRTRSFHPIVKLFTVSVTLYWLFVFCMVVHWSVFEANGVGVPFMEGLGRILEVLGRVSFLILLILIAKGWTISTAVLSERMQLLISVVVILVVYLILAIWDLAGRDPASTVYIYDTAPGIIICVLHIIWLAWFGCRVVDSFAREMHTEKKKFYFRFGIVYSIWFASLPFLVMLAALLDPWVRQKVVESLIIVVNATFMGLLGYLLWPSRAASYFEIQVDRVVGGASGVYESL